MDKKSIYRNNTLKEVFDMSEKRNSWSEKRVQTSVNPQGKPEDEANQSPTSQLEQRAKKKNTKI